MNKFNLGDRVKVTWAEFGWAGKTGTVTRTPNDPLVLGGYRVLLDEPFLGYTEPIWYDNRLELAVERPRPTTMRSAVEL